MKTIKPHKCLIALNNDGTIKEILYQYKIENDGVMLNKFFTTNVENAISKEVLNIEFDKALSYVKNQEN